MMALADRDIREMPDYCQTTGLDPRSWFRGLLDACAPYTPGELEAMTSTQMKRACTGANGVVDEGCVQRGVESARVAAEAGARSDSEGKCEYDAVTEYPGLSRFLGPALVCKARTGQLNTLFLIGGAVVLALFLMRRS